MKSCQKSSESELYHKFLISKYCILSLKHWKEWRKLKLCIWEQKEKENDAEANMEKELNNIDKDIKAVYDFNKLYHWLLLVKCRKLFLVSDLCHLRLTFPF